jgi:serine/threonine-protein kinase
MGPLLKVVAARVALLLGAVLALPLGTSPASAQDHCGAIAISQSTGRLGWSYDFANRTEAENAAKRECAKGATDCRVPVWFCNACGAIATTPDLGYGSGWAENREDAERNAIKVCQDYNPGKRCTIQRWVCTTR